MNGDDYVLDGDLAFSNSRDALKFYQTEYHRQQAEIEALKERVERMIENQSHHEGIAHAGGFEAGYQAAKAKTLTDEEIMVLYEEYIETQYASESNVLGFGRAILRKAQEK